MTLDVGKAREIILGEVLGCSSARTLSTPTTSMSTSTRWTPSAAWAATAYARTRDQFDIKTLSCAGMGSSKEPEQKPI